MQNRLIALGAEGANRLTTEQRQVLHQLGQDVVNRIQMEKLAVLFNALDEEILVNAQKHFFLVVDKLDEDWVDDPARYRLIRALIETMREFNSKVRFAKVVIALRTDLFNRVLNATTDSGFQGEKYKALCLPMRWSKRALLDVLDRRINQLVVSRYAGRQRTGYRDILPQTIGDGRVPVADYILDRTLLRPRDAIAFLNRCLEQAEGEGSVLPRHLIEAEHRYSCERLKSLADEWSIQYPHLELLSDLLTGRTAHFRLGEISADALADVSVGIVGVTNPVTGDDYRSLHRFTEEKIDAAALRRGIAMIFYEVGLIGLKTDPHLSVQWSLDTTDYVAPADISDNATVAIHTMVWYALGIKPS